MSLILRRLGGGLFAIFGAVTLVFLILYWLPGDPAALIAGDDASQETIDRIRAHLGTDRPLWDQYVVYLYGLTHGDLGKSFSTNQPVLDRLWAQIPATLALTALGSTFAIVTGLALGIVSAVNKDRWIDRTIQTILLFLVSMPSFWIGILLILLFSVTLRWLPAIGNGSLAQLVLPVACVGLSTAGRLTRMVRNSVIEVLDEPFVTALRGKGLLERQVLYRHVLRNALIPVVTMLGIIVGYLLSSAVVIETLFARQGVGRLLVEAVGVRDIPMVQGTVLFAAISYVLINTLVDISYIWIDRRIRP